MATAVHRPCAEPGCPALVQKGRCPTHFTENRGRTDRYRGSRHERGYGAEWEDTRERVLERDFYLCQVCLTRTASEVDHVVPKEAGGSDVDDNLQSICSICHEIKTGLENASRNRSRGVSADA